MNNEKLEAAGSAGEAVEGLLLHPGEAVRHDDAGELRAGLGVVRGVEPAAEREAGGAEGDVAAHGLVLESGSSRGSISPLGSFVPGSGRVVSRVDGREKVGAEGGGGWALPGAVGFATATGFAGHPSSDGRATDS